MLACKKRLKRKYIILCSKKSNITRYLHFLRIPSDSCASLKIRLHRNEDDRKSFDNDKQQGSDDWVSDTEQGQQISDSGLRLSAWQEQLDDNPFGCFFTKWRIEIMPNGGVLGGFCSFLLFCLAWRKGGLEPPRSSPWNSSESSLAKRPRKPSTTEAARDKGLRAPQRGFGVIIFT